MTNAILTDLDGVIRIWSPETHRKAERATGLPENAISRAAFSDDLLLQVITGRISDDEWRRKIADLLSKDFPEAYAERAVELWSSSPGAVDLEVLGILRACRKKARLALISNATSRLLSDLRRLGIAEDFDYIINSSEVGIRKTRSQHLLRSPGYRGSSTGAGSVHRRQRRACGSGNARLGIAGHTYVGADGLRHEAGSSGASLITLNDF